MQQTSGRTSYAHGNALRPVSEETLDWKEGSCCICYQPFSPTPLTHGFEVPVQLACGHVFGETCILRWVETNSSCPLCRSDVSSIDRQPAIPDSSLRRTNFDSSMVTPENDIWLDPYVWEDHTNSQPRFSAVHSLDVETLIASYASDHSDTEVIHLTLPPSTFLERQVCSEHTYSSSSVPHAQHDRSTFNLRSTGSLFTDLDYHTKQWMDEYLYSCVLEQEVLCNQ